MADAAQNRFGDGRRWRVLLAEDDALLADTVDEFLCDEGFSVSLVADGRQALEQAKLFAFDVLLTDLRMPHVDGLELVRQLRATRPDLPVVVMSGNAPADLPTSLNRTGAGPVAMVTKPMRLSQLLAALHRVLSSEPASVPGDP